MPAGVETMDARDMAAEFAAIGCRRAIVTRVDLTRRLGSLLSAFHASRIDFCDVSVSPDILPASHGGLRPLHPVALARLVLPDPRPHDENVPTPQAATATATPQPARKTAPAPKAWIPAS
jgi:flagellar biosynthesis protein FlhF